MEGVFPRIGVEVLGAGGLPGLEAERVLHLKEARLAPFVLFVEVSPKEAAV